MINIERLIDFVNESSQQTYDYRKASIDYYRKHGHGLNLDRVTTPEEKHIVYLYHWDDKAHGVVMAMAEVLMMDREQIERMYCAARAVKRWYERTNWERCLPYELKQRLERYVFGGC